MKRAFLALTLALLLSIISGCGLRGDSLASENAASGSIAGSSDSNTPDNGNAASDGSSNSGTGLQPSKSGSSAEAMETSASESPTVYMTTEISPEGLMAAYNALGREATGHVGVKISTGEPGDTYYLDPNLIKDLVQHVNGTIVECGTAYGGKRMNTAMHMQVAKDHGFTDIADVDIMDADGAISLPVNGGSHLKEDLVGSHLESYDFLIILSHFKGHPMAGLGGAIKNMAVGIASGIQTPSGSGKCLIHSAGTSNSEFLPMTPQDDFLESMAEAAKAVADYEGSHILYINVMNYLSVDCDCVSNPAVPTMGDIGILASLDPVALDKACVDLVNAAPDGHDLQERMKSRNGVHTIDWAQKIGLGSETYELVNIDG